MTSAVTPIDKQFTQQELKGAWLGKMHLGAKQGEGAKRLPQYLGHRQTRVKSKEGCRDRNMFRMLTIYSEVKDIHNAAQLGY